MKKQFYLSFIFLSLLFLNAPLQARHIISGTMSYKCLGNNIYEITMIIYRDCYDTGGAPLDVAASFGIYEGEVLYTQKSVGIRSQESITPFPYEDCAANFPTYCVEKGVYVTTFELPPSTETYTVVYQRCCWARSVGNIDKPDEHGISVTTEITPAATAVCNSSPKVDFPLAFASCPNVPISLDLQGNEIDGDSLSYELCMPFQGGGLVGSPALPGDPLVCEGVTPTPPCPPPYATLPFADGFDLDNPFPTANGITFDPITGTLDFTPTTQGRYIFGLCVSEFRNGELLGRYISIVLSSNQLEGVINNVNEQERPTKWTVHYPVGATHIRLQRNGTPPANSQIELLSMDGRILTSQSIQDAREVEVPLVQHTAGLYLLRIQEGQHEEIHKIVFSR
ncbi:MAG: T9SS type A sorting domain-containing protein [Bacteroidota bacterium]